MAWCDKIGLCWVALLLIWPMLVSGPVEGAAAFFTIPVLRIAFAPWIILRVIDWIVGGPRRRGSRAAAPITDLRQGTDGNYTVDR